MEKISLYIAGKKVDLDDNSFILFNYTMEDLSNPTIVKNSFSKQITLKGTPTNNEIFGNLYRADRKTIFGDGHTGVSFNPLRKTPFVIYNERNEIIESGYVKVDSVSKISGGYEYKVTLYGGLGSLFYDLTYNENGNKITLADLDFPHYDGSLKKIQSMVVNKTVIQTAWSYFENTQKHFQDNPHSAWDIINFAPCYNGIPEDFDADKVIMYGEFAQFSKYSITQDGATYKPLNGYSASMVTMSNPHSEWEMRNIRPYLQRMVVSIGKIRAAIGVYSKKLGYEIQWSPNLVDDILFRNGWITLGLIPKNERYSETAITSVLKGSLTPFDYLISIAKIYGLIFRYDVKNHIVKIESRNTFYSTHLNQVMDLSERIDRNSLQITPLVAESKWYQLGSNVVGEFASEYEKEYGIKCGVQRINTGYDFNSEVKELTKDIPLIEAVDVAERNRLFMGYFTKVQNNIYAQVFPLPLYEKVTMKWYKDGEESESLDINMTANYRNTIVPFDPEHPYVDWLPKVQFHDAEDKPVDGAHCILLYNKMQNVPDFPEYIKTCTYYLSDEHTAIDVFNEGKACWNLDASEFVRLTQLPSFRRMYLWNNEVRLDVNWGVPREMTVVDVEQDVENPNTLYANRWQAYLTDRYDVDTRILKCKVNLSGIQVCQDLLSYFFYYDNSLWVLNKISNHSITTDDLTECEFIKVKDIRNYTQGQKL